MWQQVQDKRKKFPAHPRVGVASSCKILNYKLKTWHDRLNVYAQVDQLAEVLL